MDVLFKVYRSDFADADNYFAGYLFHFDDKRIGSGEKSYNAQFI
jgi:hypothetical protein